MAEKEYNVLEIITAVNGVIDDEARAAATAVLTSVVFATPVGNPTRWQYPKSAPKGYVGGHARRNWLVSLSIPRPLVIGEAGKGGGAGAASSGALAGGRQQIARYKRLNARIIIQNNVPYIGRLNAGHSTVQPANFVQKAVQAGRVAGARGRKELP